jgi:AraC family transcriptional regulator
LRRDQQARHTYDGCVERVNRAIDHVVGNLHRPIRLAEVARVAALSPFHFHRVFRSLTGEPLGEFIRRLRLERALFLMSHAPKRPLTEIALDCGFSSPSDFSRSFKRRYGSAPSAFDLMAWRASQRRELGDAAASDGHHLREPLTAGENPDGFEVVLRDLPARSVAYIRVCDPYRGSGVPEAAERLVAWAEARGLADGQWLGYQWDDPEIVALQDCRYDVALECGSFEPEGEIGRFDFPRMRAAEVEVRGGIELELRALEWLFGTWLPGSGHVPDDHPCFEAWIGRPFAHGLDHFELYAQLPVKKPGR